MKRLLLLTLLCLALVSTSTAAVTRLPMTVVRTWLTVEAAVDGRNCRFLVDTGSPSTVVSARTAAALGIAGNATTTVGTSDGTEATMRRAVVGRMMLGDRLLTDLPVLVASDTVLDCFEIDGILGGDILRRYVVRLSLRDNYMLLADRRSEAGDIDRKRSVRMRLKHNKSYCARNYVRGAKGKYRVWALFDTGAGSVSFECWEWLHEQNALTDLHVAEGYGTSSGLMGSNVVSRRAVAMFAVPHFEFAGVDIRNIPVRSGRSSILGTQLLKWGDVVLDYPGRRIYYLADDDRVEAGDGSAGVVNIYPAFDAWRGVVVGSVWDPSLAGRVRSGDRIVRIDDMPTDSMSVCDFYRNTYKAGQTRFTIETADGETEHITMNIID